MLSIMPVDDVNCRVRNSIDYDQNITMNRNPDRGGKKLATSQLNLVRSGELKCCFFYRTWLTLGIGRAGEYRGKPEHNPRLVRKP